MQTLTTFSASAVEPTQLGGILADYMALDRARIARRAVVIRFGGLAVIAALFALLAHAFSPLARWLPVAVFLVPPAHAWFMELRLERRLAERLADVNSVTQQLPPTEVDAPTRA